MKATRRSGTARLLALLLGAGAALAACTGTPPGSVSSSAMAASAPGTAPAYYVALSHSPDTSAPDQAIVGDAFTGTVLARVSPPAGSTFAGVAGAGDDRTFVLDAQPFAQPLPPPRPLSESGQPWPYTPSEQAAVLPRTWYLLRLAPAAAGHATLTRLPVPATPAGSVVTGMALSPDASKLAVSLQADPYHQGYRQSLRVYSVTTGALLRTWTTTQTAINAFDYGIDGNSAVTWLADGVHVAFLLFTAGPYLRMVDIKQPGGDLVKDAIKVVGHQIGCDQPGSGPLEGGGAEMVRLTPDGSAVACAVGAEFNIYDHLLRASTLGQASYCTHTDATDGFTIVSATTQKPVTNLASYAEKGHCTPGEYPYPEITWTSPGDRELIGYLPYPGPGWALYRPGHVTPLHLVAGINPHYVAW